MIYKVGSFYLARVDVLHLFSLSKASVAVPLELALLPLLFTFVNMSLFVLCFACCLSKALLSVCMPGYLLLNVGDFC